MTKLRAKLHNIRKADIIKITKLQNQNKNRL